MRRDWLAYALAAFSLAGCREAAVRDASTGGTAPVGSPRLYEFSLPDIDGTPRPLAGYKGQVLLLVNVASRCGSTPQYETMQKIYDTYKDRGFRILGFPANNFGSQEPGSNAEIKEFCMSKYAVTFDMFAKISVKGDDIHPLYRYLTTEAGVDGEIGWNFTKFLVDRQGNVVYRFSTKTDPLAPELTSKIEELLAKN